jgi:hypothetical protein
VRVILFLLQASADHLDVHYQKRAKVWYHDNIKLDQPPATDHCYVKSVFNMELQSRILQQEQSRVQSSMCSYKNELKFLRV